LNFSFSFRFVDENYRIFVVVVVFVTKINLLSSTKIFVFVVVDEKKHCYAVVGLQLAERQLTRDFVPHTPSSGFDLDPPEESRSPKTP